MPSELFKKLGIEVKPPAKPPKESLACAWNLGSPCAGEVRVRQYFDEQISVPVCSSHNEDHTIIEVLTKNHSYSVEEILTMSPEQRKALYYKCVL